MQHCPPALRRALDGSGPGLIYLQSRTRAALFTQGINKNIRARIMSRLKLAVLLAALAGPAQAQSWVAGAGFSDFSDSLSEDTAILSAEYHFTPFYTRERLSAGWGAALSVFGTGDVHLGGGITGTYLLGGDWFLEGSVMPGVYVENETLNDLGSAFEIRSLIAVGHRFENGQAVSLALTHKSNASTAAENPGVNSLLVRWHVPMPRQ